MSNRIKVAVIWISLGPYHVARLRALGALPDLDVTAIQLSRGEISRDWRTPDIHPCFAVTTLTEERYERADRYRLAVELRYQLDSLQPDVIAVAGYSEKLMRTAAGWAKTCGRLSILMSESQRRDRPRKWIQERLKAWWIKHHYDAAFVGGQRSADYLEGLGFPGDRIWRGYDVVDNAHFAELADSVRGQEAAWREKLGLPARYFIYVGRFVEEKNLRGLLAAYSRYRSSAEAKTWDLVLLGSGPLETELKAFTANNRIDGVHWLGFKQIDELPVYYGLASCLILPSSSEPWGLVVNEAMAAGLPVLVSDRTGASSDLVWPGINGYIFPAEDVGALSRMIGWIASGGVSLEAMGRTARQAVALYTPDNWARGLADCLRVSMAQRRIRH